MANTITTTARTATTDLLVTQLRALEQLTQAEAQVARIRVGQASTDAVRRELRQNGDNAVRRTRRISDQLRSLNAVPDVITPALGRLLALVKGTLDQAQPIDEALLGDLTLEHQLLDRARYVRILARRAERPAVEKLADELVTAHEATVDWLTTVLAEEALGGPAALVPTPLQRVAGGVVHAVGLPTRFAVDRFNRAVHTVYRTGDAARDTVGDAAGRVAELGAGAREVASAGIEAAVAGRDAALHRAERVADRNGADDTAAAAREARAQVGALTAAELPIRGYDEMTAQNAIAAIRELDQAADLNAIIAFEQHHKNRSGVVSAAQTRFAAVAKEAAGVR